MPIFHIGAEYMANEQHLNILKEGVKAWNRWRNKNPDIAPNLSGVDFTKANLKGIDFSFGTNLIGTNFTDATLTGTRFQQAVLGSAILSRANLTKANLANAYLCGANLTEANLTKAYMGAAQLNGAILTNANLSEAGLESANLTGAELIGANLTETDLSGANLHKANFARTKLTGANLMNANLVETNFEKADLSGCHIYGISAWRLNLDGATQLNLIITPLEEPVITVDNLEVAQFIYLMLHNEKIRDVINTIGKKGVLILGRFTPVERKLVLEAIREKLRQMDYVPIVFDFERPKDRDFTETIKTLAGMCRFIIADITNPKSSPLELQAIVPDYMIPFVPIIQAGEKPFAMFKDLANKYGWVLKPVRAYDSVPNLMKGFEKAIIKPALEKHNELMAKKAEELSTTPIENYLSNHEDG